MSYNYKVEPTTNPLTADKLYEGLMVCFSDVTTNPNRVGILEKTTTTINSVRYPWAATIDSVRYEFDRNGCLPGTTTPVLYGVLSNGSLDPTTDTYESRAGGQGEADTVTLTTMYPKDYFACHALNALIQKIDSPLAMNDGTIALLAAKSYKIAQAMAKEAYESRENDKTSEEQSGASYVEVDETTLQTNTDRILYNINESLKAINTIAGDKMAIDSTTKTASFTAVVGKYYFVNVAASGTVNITLTTPDDNTNLKSCVFRVVLNASSELNILSQNSTPMYGTITYSAITSKIYEINALWNGVSWSIAHVELRDQN